MKRILNTAFALLFLAAGMRAQEENSLTRDEVATIKKKLVAVVDALGGPPPGYASTDESFYLPTEAYKDASGGYTPTGSSVSLQYGSASEKKAKKSSEEFQKEYEKKMAEAQAKNDYQAMMKLAQEMQQKAGQAQLEAVEGKKKPIDVRIQFNANPYQTIDPDAVVFESAGVIALKFKDDADEDRGRVAVYFDPVNLKETKTLSKVDLKYPKAGVGRKTTVLNATLELNGPIAEIESWAKRIALKKVLAQIDAAK